MGENITVKKPKVVPIRKLSPTSGRDLGKGGQSANAVSSANRKSAKLGL